MTKIPLVFLGTPSFAKYHLKALLEDDQFEVKGVVSQPDRKSGRKMQLKPSDVKSYALDQDLEVITPESVNAKDSIEKIKSWKAEALVVVAFGQLIGDELLKAYENKIVNVHGSLLPLWRGAAPIQRSIMAGDEYTGVSLQVMVKKLDAGNIIGERKIKILNEWDAIDLHNQLEPLGADLLKTDFVKFLKDELQSIAQDESLVTYAHKLQKTESKILWSKNAKQIFNEVRGLKMGPGSFTLLDGKKLKIHKTKLSGEFKSAKKKPGQILQVNTSEFYVQCGDTILEVIEVQPESKPKMKVQDYLMGHSLKEGDCFEF